MAEAPGITWVASYPKSGSTWIRTFLVNMLEGGSEPAHINRLDRVPHCATRRLFDDHAAVDSSDLTREEVDELRPRVYEDLVAESPRAVFLKVHDRFGLTPSGEPFFPLSVTRGTIYVVRNPLDVACSYAAHLGNSIDDTIDILADRGHTLGHTTGTRQAQLVQLVGSWSDHVDSWLSATHAPVHLVRYEDLIRTPDATFRAIAAFAGLEQDGGRLEHAITRSDFRELRRQEEQAGFFREGSLDAPIFFRRGEAGCWRNELTADQMKRIVGTHGPVMAKLGYIDEYGVPAR